MCQQIEPLAEIDFCFQKTNLPLHGKDGNWRQSFGMVPKIAKKMLNRMSWLENIASQKQDEFR